MKIEATSSCDFHISLPSSTTGGVVSDGEFCPTIAKEQAQFHAVIHRSKGVEATTSAMPSVERGTCSIPTRSTISNSALSDATIITEEED